MYRSYQRFLIYAVPVPVVISLGFEGYSSVWRNGVSSFTWNNFVVDPSSNLSWYIIIPFNFSKVAGVKLGLQFVFDLGYL